MIKSNIQEKTENFAIRIVKLNKFLKKNFKEYSLSDQILRSGTSIGANVVEAFCGCSKRDFVSKMYISFKECAETKFWLRILYKTEYLSKQEFDSIYADCEEISKILNSITKTSRQEIK